MNTSQTTKVQQKLAKARAQFMSRPDTTQAGARSQLIVAACGGADKTQIDRIMGQLIEAARHIGLTGMDECLMLADAIKQGYSVSVDADGDLQNADNGDKLSLLEVR